MKKMSKQILTNGRNISIDINNKVKKIVIVVSHERSGTHFLMNSISNCQDVYTNNWFDFDPNVSHSSNINFYFKDSVQNLCDQMFSMKCSSIIKSHHHYKFFKNIDKKNIVFFYIYRNPYDTLKSFWNYINYLNWWEGPRGTTFKDFVYSEPEGMMMRYQNGQENSILSRWEHNVNSWVNASRQNQNIHIFKYSDLKNHYETQIDRISKILNCDVQTYEKPERNNYLRYDAKLKISSDEENLVRYLLDEILSFCRI